VITIDRDTVGTGYVGHVGEPRVSEIIAATGT
jgi:hypothetical protein